MLVFDKNIAVSFCEKEHMETNISLREDKIFREIEQSDKLVDNKVNEVRIVEGQERIETNA